MRHMAQMALGAVIATSVVIMILGYSYPTSGRGTLIVTVVIAALAGLAAGLLEDR